MPYRLSNIRWLILVLNGLTCLGSYYANDVSAPLYEVLQSNFDISTVRFTNLFWSSYSYSGVIWPFIGGLIADRFGQGKMYVLNSFVVCIGVGIMTLGVYHLETWLVLTGNIIFGLGAENLNIS